MTWLDPNLSRYSLDLHRPFSPALRQVVAVVAVLGPFFSVPTRPLSPLPAAQADETRSSSANRQVRSPDSRAISPQPATNEPVSLLELQREIRQTLRAEAQATTLADRTAAIYELCALHREIVADSRFRSLESLQEMRREVASRLVKVQADLKRKIYREKSDKRPIDPRDELLRSISDHWSLIGAVQGGPAELLASQRWFMGDVASGAARGGQGVPDNGQGLVDLIQATIHPGFWDVQGGPGTIIYYSPLRCLVVRATDEVHGDVGGLVQGLRAANP